MSYMSKANNRKSKRFALELKVVDALRQRLAVGGGHTMIILKEDGVALDITRYNDNKYHVVSQHINKWFDGLDEIAEFILARGGK